MTDRPSDRLARESKDLADRGVRIGEDRSEPRRFYCRHCGAQTMATQVPAGWYTLVRAAGPLERGHRLGVYCSLDCLAGEIPRLAGVEADLGKTWQQSVDQYRQRGTRP